MAFALSTARTALQAHLPVSFAETGIDAVLNAAAAHQKAGRSAEAAEHVAGLNPAFVISPEQCHLAGLILVGAEDWMHALVWFERARLLRPGFVEAIAQIAGVLQKLGRLEEALSAFNEALKVGHVDAGAHADLCNNRGLMLLEMSLFEAALASFDAALAAKSDFPEAQVNRGIAMLKLARSKDALIAFNSALAMRPVYPAALVGRGEVLRELGQLNEAEASFDLALMQDPDCAHAKNNKGALQRLRGNLGRGWDCYGGRAPKTNSRIAIPEGNGEFPPGEKLVVFDQPGFSDTLQFCRYLPLLAKAGVDVTLFCRSKLMRLLRSIGAGVRCVDDLEPHEGFDNQIALPNLPSAFKTDLTTIPMRVPYLFAEPARIAKWAERLAAQGHGRAFKIGLYWDSHANVEAEPTRSLPLSSFARLAARDDLRLIGLQKCDSSDERALASRMHIEQLGDDFEAGPDAFVDTAAAMQTLDLIITCDTAVAHLAGALGRPVFVLLKKIPDWRWLLDREDSPWYPTMRLFRQKERGDWDEVVTRVVAATEMMMAYTSGLHALRSAAMI
jgi:tetratricopeptide (TPR) repeat protein